MIPNISWKPWEKRKSCSVFCYVLNFSDFFISSPSTLWEQGWVLEWVWSSDSTVPHSPSWVESWYKGKQWWWLAELDRPWHWVETWHSFSQPLLPSFCSFTSFYLADIIDWEKIKFFLSLVVFIKILWTEISSPNPTVRPVTLSLFSLCVP